MHPREVYFVCLSLLAIGDVSLIYPEVTHYVQNLLTGIYSPLSIALYSLLINVLILVGMIGYFDWWFSQKME